MPNAGAGVPTAAGAYMDVPESTLMGLGWLASDGCGRSHPDGCVLEKPRGDASCADGAPGVGDAQAPPPTPFPGRKRLGCGSRANAGGGPWANWYNTMKR